MKKVMLLSSLLALAAVAIVVAAAVGVVRVAAIRGDGNYYVDQAVAEAQGRYLSAEGLGIWHGGGLRRHGLEAGQPVTPGVFKRLMLGFGSAGEPLVQNAGNKRRNAGKERRSGTELNLSTSKYFDVLYALGTDAERNRLRALFQSAVQAVLDHIEREYASCGRGHDRKNTEPCGLSIALFFHETNRLGEPFLHCHAVVLGIASRLDGTTGAIDHGPFYHTQRLASVLLDLHIAHGLFREFGIRVARNGYSFRVPGVPNSLTQLWSSRKRQIDAHLKRSGEANEPKAAERAAKKTRGKKRDWDAAERRERWAVQAAAHAINLDEVFRRGRPIAVPPPSTERQRAEEAVREAAETLLGEVDRFTRAELIIKAGLGCLDRGVSAETLIATIDQALARPLEHNLRGAGTRKGEAAYHFWDPPEPRPVSRVDPLGAAASRPTEGREAAQDAAAPREGTARDPAGQFSAPDPLDGTGRRDTPGREQPAGDGSVKRPGTAPRSEWGRAFGTIQALAERLLTDPVRAWLLVRRVANELVRTHGHFTPLELVEAATRAGRKDVSGGQIARAAELLLKHRTLTGLSRSGERDGAPVYTTRAHERAERKFLREGDRLADRRGRPVGKPRLDRAARSLIGFGEDFVQAVRGLAHPRSRLSLLHCPAGEGKAALLRELGRAYEDAGFRVRRAAPTGPAVEALAGATGKPSATVRAVIRDASPMPLLHLLKRIRLRGRGALASKLEVAERLRRPLDPLTRRDVVLVDGAHLLGTREGAELLALVRRSGAKIVLVGDRDRAPGMLAGGGFRHLIDRHRAYRIGAVADPGRVESVAATCLRAGRPSGAVQALAQADRIWRGKSLAAATDLLLERYVANEALLEPARHHVVTSSNREAARLNRRIQRQRKRHKLLGLAAVRLADGSRVHSGDRVVFTRSRFLLKVKTGHSGTVVSVNPLFQTVSVRLDRGGLVTVPVKRFPHLTLGYASSVPRASELAHSHFYALVRGGGFFKQSVLALLEQGQGRVDVFTTVRNERLSALLARDGTKTLAVCHRDSPSQTRDHENHQPHQHVHNR